jgi:transcriptional regulator with XRE-family HTH domain
MVDRERVSATFGAYVKQQREQRHWTRVQLAGKAGVTPQYISFLERGRHMPSLDSVLHIAWAFGMHGTELVKIVEDALIAPEASP